MERLTKIDGIGQNELIRCFGCTPEKAGENLENCGYCEEGWRKALDRLAAYEDTGLMPDEVKDMAENAETRLLTWFEAKYGFPVGELMDFCEARQQGRLVELPCKAGEYWRDQNGDRVRIGTISFCKTRSNIGTTDMVTYGYEDEEDEFSANWTYFKSHFLREEAETVLKGESYG